MTAKYKLADVAACICDILDKPAGVGLLKLEKLCYYAQAWYYAIHEESLIEEAFVYSENGPHARSIWNGSLTDGSSALETVETEEKGQRITFRDGGNRTAYRETISSTDYGHIGRVCEWLGDYSGRKLSDLSHTEKPWCEARNVASVAKSADVGVDIVIRNEDMLYYKTHHLFPLIAQCNENPRNEALVIEAVVIKNGFVAIMEFRDTDDYPYKNELNSLTFEHTSKLCIAHTAEGKQFEYFWMNRNTLRVITQDAREHILKSLYAIAELEDLINNKKIDFYWETYLGEEGLRYIYASPKLGIAADNTTVNDTIKNALEFLEYNNDMYEKHPPAPQDAEEAMFVKLAYEVYKFDPNRLRTLLGLTQFVQLQGETHNAQNVQ